MAPTHYKLHYFNVRGRGECIRQLLVLAGQEFEDYRIEFPEWPSKKSDYPFGQLPVLEEDGKMLAQEFAICRYLAKKFGFAGKNEWEQAQVDALADQWKDFFSEIRPYYRVAVVKFDQGDVEQLKKDVFEPAVAKNLPLFVKALEESGSGYFIGKFSTWIDILVAEFLSTISTVNPEIFEQYPSLLEHRDRIHNIPRIKQWRESRPATPF